MSESELEGPGGESPGNLPPPQEPKDTPMRLVLGLFLVPLLVVVLCVAVFIGFGWIAYEGHGVNDYVNDLRSYFPNRRWQAAYELSKILAADPNALQAAPGALADARRLFVEEKDDPRVRQYLALVLGRSHDKDALPLLVQAAREGDSELRIYALWGLGALGDARAREPLVQALADPDAGIRKTAAFALGGLGDRSAAPALEPLLNDPTADVRWNAALSLARLGSGAGAPVLEQMLDRQRLAAVPGITPEQQEDAMISAVAALAATQGERALPLLERLAASDPSLKVRQAAIVARRQLAAPEKTP